MCVCARVSLRGVCVIVRVVSAGPPNRAKNAAHMLWRWCCKVCSQYHGLLCMVVFLVALGDALRAQDPVWVCLYI